jgi:hypothetical protein
MHGLAVAGAILLVLFVLWDAFETIVLPRRVSRRFRLTRFFYQGTWKPWRAIGRRKPAGNARENFLSIFGPISILLLLALWALGLVFGFAALHWGLQTPMETRAGLHGFPADLYFSGTTFVTLGLGDVAPQSGPGRLLTFVESGIGFGFLALVIGYLPTLFQSFARREVNISLLDARAGSPPTAAELVRRHAGEEGSAALTSLLQEWEIWSADLLGIQVSFPVLAYFLSPHDNESWVSALTTVLDVCSLIIAGMENAPKRAARLTFAMARHAVVDLASIFHLHPHSPHDERLTPEDLRRLREALVEAGKPLREGTDVDDRLARLRGMYEPWVNALSEHLLMPLPPWVPPAGARDNWQSTA